ncbi:hypothetical protein JTB14_034278 [Gonioctena quinquepunctata]|nr:hypothetical protein JTB14_034278 [Gonioctena quinquepunctata]
MAAISQMLMSVPVTFSDEFEKLRYTQEQLEIALELISSGQKLHNAVSKEFGIPKGTLHNKTHSLVPINRKIIPSTVLTKQEEDRLEKWIIDKAKLGFLMHQDDVKDAVQKVLRDLKRPNPFKDDRPGNM